MSEKLHYIQGVWFVDRQTERSDSWRSESYSKVLNTFDIKRDQVGVILIN